MKKLSIFILFLFTFSAAAFTHTVGQPSAKPRPSRRILFFENFPFFPKPIDQPPEPPAPPRAPHALSDCPAGRNTLPCLLQFASQSGNNNLTPINSTCCAVLFNATAECAGDVWPDVLYPQALAYCQHEHPELNPSTPQSSPLPPPSSPPPPSSNLPPPPPPSPQAPSGLCDLPANEDTYLQCSLQFNGHDGTKGSHINSTCCAFLLNAAEQCPGGHWSEFWPRSIAYCQHPDQNSSQTPPPPPPPPSSLPPPGEAANKCWNFLDTMQSCINEIMSGFFDKRLGMGPACCSAMASWGEDCFSELSRQFPDLFYPSWLRQQCSLPN